MDPPSRAVTGTIPQPYVTNEEAPSMPPHSSSGTDTKWCGAGPRQNHTSPLNSRSTGSG